MMTHYLDELKQQSQRILLLQGPIGDFFFELASWLKAEQKTVYKINLNAGDEFFYPNEAENTVAYRDTLAHFGAFLVQFCQAHHIDNVLCFGDNRAYHKIAKSVCHQLNLTFWAFEEGYFRPDYVTLEKGGVNAFSPIPATADFFKDIDESQPLPVPERLAKGFIPMAKIAMRYYFEASFKRENYPFYQHHRELDTQHYIKLWVVSGLKRLYYWLADKHFAKQTKQGKFGEFFIVPLQVHNDSQVVVHSDFDSVAHFLRTVLDSFVQFAPQTAKLIVKHHPMDRGFIDYQSVIDEYISHYPQLKNRVFYVHDVPLPVFLRQAKGMVTINSTSGISALLHNMPVKILGRASYDFEGLTDQATLNEFWLNPKAPDPELFQKYRHFHLSKTQINGSFYSKVKLESNYITNSMPIK